MRPTEIHPEAHDVLGRIEELGSRSGEGARSEE